MSLEQKSRVTAVFLQSDGGEPETGDGYHLWQSKQMLALGGAWGSFSDGMPVDDPAAYRLPAGQTDFIFCLIAALLAWRLGIGLIHKFVSGESTMLVRMPYWWSYSFAVASMVLLCIVCLARIASAVGELRR